MDQFTGIRAGFRMKGLALLLAAIILLLCACAATPGGPGVGPGETAAPIGSAAPETDGGPSTGPEEAAAPIGSAVPETEEAGPEPASSTETSTEITVLWEDNESVSALWELAKQAPLTVQMSPYGGFEQVGPIGRSLPRNDVQTTTEPGDIVLYSGNQIVVFYGSNSWAYTRLGKIQGMDQAALTKLLGNGAVTLALSAFPTSC